MRCHVISVMWWRRCFTYTLKQVCTHVLTGARHNVDVQRGHRVILHVTEEREFCMCQLAVAPRQRSVCTALYRPPCCRKCATQMLGSVCQLSALHGGALSRDEERVHRRLHQNPLLVPSVLNIFSRARRSLYYASPPFDSDSSQGSRSLGPDCDLGDREIFRPTFVSAKGRKEGARETGRKGTKTRTSASFGA